MKYTLQLQNNREKVQTGDSCCADIIVCTSNKRPVSERTT